MQEISKYKVIILGAGMAGLYAAIYLKKINISEILLINKSNYKVHKACSGILTEKANKLLKIIDISLLNYKKWDSVIGSYERENAHQFSGNDVYAYQDAGLNRINLDEILYSKCKDSNIDILEDSFVDSIDRVNNCLFIGDDKYCYDYLLDARGIEANYKHKLIGVEAKFNNPSIYVNELIPEINLFKDIKGYAWCVRYQDNVTIGFTDKYIKRKNYINFLNKLVENEVDNSYTKIDYRAAFIPCKPVNKLVNKNTLLIGDRAGLVDPLTQEGIYYAFKSAYEACNSIKLDNSGLYETKMRPIVKSLKKAYFYRKIFFKSSFQNKLWNVASTHGFTTYVFSLYSSMDDFSYKNIFKYHKEYKKGK